MTAAERFHRATRVEVPAADLGTWHFRPGAIHRLIPPWESIEVLQEAAPLIDGAHAVLRIRKPPFLSTTLAALHSEVDPPRQFVDTQERGPFAHWRHVHRFLPDSDGHSTIDDAIEYALPGGMVGRLLLGRLMRSELNRQFAFRHARTRSDLRRHRELDARFGDRRLRIGITGASGLVGTQLSAFLTTGGHEVVRFVRGLPRGNAERRWNPTDPEHGIDPRDVEDLDAMVHLAGEPIAARRWTAEQRHRIRTSRVDGTRTVANAIARAKCRPSVLLCASAIGFYGDRGESWVDEASAGGEGFLPDVVREWELAADAARRAGVRTVHVRVGIVLSAAGGALGKMLTPFKLGAGGPIGSGKQGFSWISLDDLIGALAFCVRNPDVAGAINAVAPGALPQRGFASVLGRVLGRPSFAPLPAPIVRLLFGDMGQRLLLEGVYVRPTALLSHGFRFEHASLEQALRLELGRLHADGNEG